MLKHSCAPEGSATFVNRCPAKGSGADGGEQLLQTGKVGCVKNKIHIVLREIRGDVVIDLNKIRGSFSLKSVRDHRERARGDRHIGRHGGQTGSEIVVQSDYAFVTEASVVPEAQLAHPPLTAPLFSKSLVVNADPPCR